MPSRRSPGGGPDRFTSRTTPGAPALHEPKSSHEPKSESRVHCSTNPAAPCPGVALTTLKPGEKGAIVRTDLPEDEKALLRAMGMRDHARIVLCRLGEPCIVRVMGGCGCSFRIGLAKPLAEKVFVGPEQG